MFDGLDNNESSSSPMESGADLLLFDQRMDGNTVEETMRDFEREFELFSCTKTTALASSTAAALSESAGVLWTSFGRDQSKCSGRSTRGTSRLGRAGLTTATAASSSSSYESVRDHNPEHKTEPWNRRRRTRDSLANNPRLTWMSCPSNMDTLS
jgi:hypothetical protein